MKILAFEKELPKADPGQFRKHGREEALKIWELTQEGIIRASWFRRDCNSAVLELECRDLEEAEELLSRLPFVREELICFELIALRPYPGFARLFSE